MTRVASLPTAVTTGQEFSPDTGILQRKCSCGGTCDKCRDKDDESLHRKATGPTGSMEAPPIVHDVIGEPGRPLDDGTRTEMERRFGHNFADVRVHTDGRAADSAHAVSAQAYTVGQHVVFGANQFSPATAAGKHLLAHELAHTLQQSSGARLQHRLIVREHDSPDERAADRVADAAVRGDSVPQMAPLERGAGQSSGAVQRKGGLLSPQQVDAVYIAWIAEIQKSRSIKGWTTALDMEVRERVKKQVGPGNWANFLKWEEAENEKHWKKGQEENKPKPKTDWLGGQDQRYDEMWSATESLRKEVVRVERAAAQINFGTGAKGAIARGTAGAYTGFWGVGARTVTSVSEHAPMLVLGTGLTALGFETGDKLLASEGKAIKQEGEEMGADVHTAGRLVGGDMQASYEATRPSYKKYSAAFSTFSDHATKFKNMDADGVMTLYMARAPHLGGMEAAMKEMKEAGNEFLMACAKLGIEHDAAALNKMGRNIVKGAEGAVETAVTGVVPELAPGLTEIKSAVKGAKRAEKEVVNEAKEQLGKKLAKGADDAADGSAKKADDAVGAGTKKADDAAAKGANKADDASGAPGQPKAEPTPQAQAGPKSPKDAPAKKVPEADAKALRENASKVGPVTDEKAIADGYIGEIAIGKHTYRRHKDGTWCRFSKPLCNFKVDPDIEARFAKWVEAPTPQGPAKVRRPGPPPDTGHGKAAREEFDKVREAHAKKLGARSGEDVHHAIELQTLDRYPGAYSAQELNAFNNMRGIPSEVKLTKELQDEISKRGLKPGTKEYSDLVTPYLGSRKQLHNSKIRETWDRHYVQLNENIAKLGLKPGTSEYRTYVRQYLESARKEIDHLYEAFFTEVKRGKQQWKGAAR
jgi:hypothetical protein